MIDGISVCAKCAERFTDGGFGQRSPFNEDVCWQCCESGLTHSASWRQATQDGDEATASPATSSEEDV